MNEELNRRAEEAKTMMSETAGVDHHMKRLQDELHKMTARQLFEIFPFLPDAMEPNEIRHLGERINRHLNNLSEELKNFAYTVQGREVKYFLLFQHPCVPDFSSGERKPTKISGAIFS